MIRKDSLTGTKLTVLSGHYKDTQKIGEANVKNRDRTFLLILVLLAVMAFQFFSPQSSSSVISQIVKNQLELDTAISMNYVSSLIWFSLFAITIRYFQIVINLEKHYNYIHDLERILAKEYAGKAFTREGRSYLQDYPIFSSWLHVVYRFIFPILLVAGVAIKIVSEWKVREAVTLPLGLNTLICLMLIVSTCLYVYSLTNLEKDTEESL